MKIFIEKTMSNIINIGFGITIALLFICAFSALIFAIKTVLMVIF